MTAGADEKLDFKPDFGGKPKIAGVRPKDASTMILIDRSTGTPRVLLGRRASAHVFMPDIYVFPGGRRDPRDHALPFRGDLNPVVTEKLCAGVPASVGVKRARALALAAIRELHEETGILPGADGAPADLSTLRYVARAITPPGMTRRFDTRFFATFVDEANLDMGRLGDSSELEDVRWLDISDQTAVKMHHITLRVLEDLQTLLKADPSLPFGSPVPFYFTRNGQFVRSRL